ncbi:hypothetical protein, partial [Lacticaseibacillus paracasei]|uniref:hypothetical protein n=1 Tax=Lacticaseibacillus paracasei TaxID=1597 RepID=UPI0019560439
IFAHAITTDAWRNSLDHYQEFVIIVALDLKIEEENNSFFSKNSPLETFVSINANLLHRQ